MHHPWFRLNSVRWKSFQIPCQFQKLLSYAFANVIVSYFKFLWMCCETYLRIDRSAPEDPILTSSANFFSNSYRNSVAKLCFCSVSFNLILLRIKLSKHSWSEQLLRVVSKPSNFWAILLCFKNFGKTFSVFSGSTKNATIITRKY